MERLSDDALLSLARRGDASAFGELFSRHRTDAVRAASRLVDEHEAEDVVSVAFERIFSNLRGGRGPSVSFRHYLSSTVRNAAIDRLRRGDRQIVTAPEDLVPLLVEDDETTQRTRSEVVRDALKNLPERWQKVLWLSEVDRIPHKEIGALLDLSPNAVAALAVRARRGLADAYLRQYLAAAPSPACRTAARHLPGYINGTLSRHRRISVDDHIATCTSCPNALIELEDARHDIAGLLAPLLGALAAPAGPSASVPPLVDAVASESTNIANVTSTGAAAKAIVGVTSMLTAAALAVGLTTRSPGDAPVDAPAAAMSDLPVSFGPRASSAPPHTPAPNGQTPWTGSPESGHGQAPTVRTTPLHEPSTVPDTKRSPEQGADNATTATVLDPRVASASVTSSPRGSDWRRLVVQVQDHQPGLKVAVSAIGGHEYCIQTCDIVSESSTWLANASAAPGTADLVIDLLASQTTVIDIGLTGSGWTDADSSNNSRSVEIQPPG